MLQYIVFHQPREIFLHRWLTEFEISCFWGEEIGMDWMILPKRNDQIWLVSRKCTNKDIWDMLETSDML